MKFEVLLETLEVRQFRGRYLPYTTLRKQLLELKSKQPAEAQDAIEKWRGTVQAETARIAAHIETGLKELQVGLSALSELSKSAAEGNAPPYMEIRSLDAFDNLSDGLGRYRDFAEVNYAVLIKLMQAYDKELGTDAGVNTYLPAMVETLRLERFDSAEAEIKEAVRSCSLVSGVEANPRVARMMAGLGTLRRSGLGHADFNRPSFALGLVFGLCGAFLLMILMLCFLPSLRPETFNTKYFLAPLGLFRLTLSVPLVYWSMGAVTWVCDVKHINYMFLLGIDPRCQLNSSFFMKRAALLTSTWMLILIGYVVDYKFELIGSGDTKSAGVVRGSWHYHLYPIATLLITLVVELSPSKVFQYSYRWGIIKSFCRFASAPWHVVIFADNIIGDVVTSLSRPLQDVTIAGCYMISHYPQSEEDLDRFAHHQSHCGDWERAYFRPLVTAIPLMLRAAQCARRFKDTQDIAHIQNFFKFTASVCVILVGRFGFSKPVVVAMSIFATTYSIVWDIVKDWGLGPYELQRIYRMDRSEAQASSLADDARQTPFLATAGAGAPAPGDFTRETSVDLRSSAQKKRLFGAYFYGFACIFDILARCTWTINFLPITFISKDLDHQAALFFYLVVVEISRRAVWAIIRMEWEQLSNASAFRSLLWVPVHVKTSYRKSAAAATEARDVKMIQMSEK